MSNPKRDKGIAGSFQTAGAMVIQYLANVILEGLRNMSFVHPVEDTGSL